MPNSPDSPDTPDDPLQLVRRARPVVSCLECRRKKLKCDRKSPCQQCLKIGQPRRCVFQEGQEPEPNPVYSPQGSSKRRRLDGPAPYDQDAAFIGLDERQESPQPVVSGAIIENLLRRVARLENTVLAPSPLHLDGAVVIDAPPPPSLQRPGIHPPDPDVPTKPDQTPTQFKEACAFMTKLQNGTGDANMANLRLNLKAIHQSVELNNHKLQHKILPDSTNPMKLPSLNVCEKLGVHYFDNMEHCFRILHYPTFRTQLKIFFTDERGEQACSFAFVPQLIGVLAIATVLGTHDECVTAASCSLIQPPWALKFMSDFLAGVPQRQRYLLPVLQVRMLLLICSWVSLERTDDLFQHSGEVLRDALIMRMDQDPSTLAGVSTFHGELRRRMWMTIVETDLMISILCKIPCMVPPYTSRPPRNIDDDEIFEGIASLPRSQPMEEWTDSLCQYVLSQSFPRRLAACKQMDSSSHVKFEDVLLHTRYLEQVLQELPPPLRFSYLGDEASKTPPRLMARMELDFSIRRPLMHLYTSVASAPNADDIQQEARAGFLQSCLMITTFQDFFDPRFSEIDVPRPQGYWDFFYNIYRLELGQSIRSLCLEINRLVSATATPAPTASEAPLGHDSRHLRLLAESTTVGGTNDAAAATRPYTKESLIDAVQQTLEPMKLRLSRLGANFKDLVYFVILLTSVLPATAEELTREKSKDARIQEALQGLVHDCLGQLERDHVPIVPILPPLPQQREDAFSESSASRSMMDGDDGAGAGAGTGPSIPGAVFDPPWANFPAVELFEPLERAELSRLAVNAAR